ncbi:uncharacterized protein LOC144451588 [Glandiceps talaboti]
MTAAVETSTDMPTLLSRKPRGYQSASEKLEHLQNLSRHIRNRADFLNNREKAHLRMRTKQIETHEYAAYSGLYRFKDYMKVDLIDMHKSKKRIQRGVTDFEQALKEGKNLPVFRSEYERLKSKQRKLERLEAELRGPNSFNLAKDLNTRLKLVDSTLGVNKRGRKINLPPIDRAGTEVENSPAPPETSSDDKTEERPQLGKEEENETDKSDINNNEEKAGTNQSSAHPVTKAPVPKKNAMSGVDVMLASNPVYQRMIQKQQEEEAELRRQEEEAELERKRKEELAKPLPPLRETLFADMNLRMPRKVVRRRSPVSGSLLKRKRHAERRISQYKEQSKSDVERKLSNSISSLNKLAHGAAKETTKKRTPRGSDNSDAASTIASLSSDDSTKVARKKKRREGGLMLPPIRVDVNLLTELKEQRIRHKKQSYGLPGLP